MQSVFNQLVELRNHECESVSRKSSSSSSFPCIPTPHIPSFKGMMNATSKILSPGRSSSATSAATIDISLKSEDEIDEIVHSYLNYIVEARLSPSEQARTLTASFLTQDHFDYNEKEEIREIREENLSHRQLKIIVLLFDEHLQILFFSSCNFFLALADYKGERIKTRLLEKMFRALHSQSSCLSCLQFCTPFLIL